MNQIFGSCSHYNLFLFFPWLPIQVGLHVISDLRAKLEDASIVWNSITTTDANILERTQQKYAALCYNRFLPHVYLCESSSLEYLELHALRKSR
jgi:hypothetical protein